MIWQERYAPTPNLAACCACKVKSTVSVSRAWPALGQNEGRPLLKAGEKPFGDSTLAHRRGTGGKGTHSDTWEARTGRVCRQGSSNTQLAFFS